LGYQADLGDAEILCELLVSEGVVVGWLVEDICTASCPLAADGALVLGGFDAARL
jgi:hypothetical protein